MEINDINKVDNESISGESLNSFNNAEIIAAAFSSSLSIKQIQNENEESQNEDSVNTVGSILSFQAEDNFDLSNQNDLNFVEKIQNNSDDSLTDTIAKVASGSISSDTCKIIEGKQLKMIEDSKLKENLFLKKKAEAKTKNSHLKSDIRKSHQIIALNRKRRHRRTKKEILNDSAKASAAIEAVLSNLKKSNSSSNENKYKFRKNLYRRNLSSIDNSLKGHKFKLIHKGIQRKREMNKKNNLKDNNCNYEKQLVQVKQELEEVSINEDVKSNKKIKHKPKSPKKEIKEEDKQNIDINENDTLDRKCLICDIKINQDLLNDHYSKHFYESAKCRKCDKVSSNPANFVTHTLTHLPSQFFCVKCDKRFRQPLVYRRHREECSKSNVQKYLISNLVQKSAHTINTRQKRKSSIDSPQYQKSSKIKAHETLPEENIKRRRRTRTEPIVSLQELNFFSSKNQKQTQTKKIKIEAENTGQDNLNQKETESLQQAKRRPGRPPKINQKEEFENDVDKFEKIQFNESDDDKVIQKSKEKEESQDALKRKYEKKVREIDLSKKQRLRSFRTTKKSNNENDLIDLYIKSALKPRTSKVNTIIKNSKKSNHFLNRKNKTKSTNNSDFEDISDTGNKKPKEKSTKNEISSSSSTTSSSFPSLKSSISPETKSKKKTSDDTLLDEDTNSDIDDHIDELDEIAVSDIDIDEESSDKEKTEIQLTKKKTIDFSISGANNIEHEKINSDRSNESFDNEIHNLTLKTTKDLSKCGTYKIKIQPRRGSNSSSSNINLAVNQKKSVNGANSTQLTPNKNKIQNDQSINQTTYFECPECDKKFVSYFGLVQHYDQHPTLSVNCTTCEITFENHHALVLHNANVHGIIDNSLNLAKDKENLLNKRDLTTMGLVKSLINSSKTVNFNKLSQKTHSNNELVNQNDNSNDLSSIPSIMTRTSRLGQTSILNTNSSILPNKNQNFSSSLSNLNNHTLTVKTSGFADLSFIDFSCISFPRIAQNYCEIWPRKLTVGNNSNNIGNNNENNSSDQPLHNYKCNKCGFYFPCIAALNLHKMKKKFGTCKLDLNLSTNNSIKSSSCEMFMVNSKYLDYEKTLDEIISKIEEDDSEEISIEKEESKNDFLSWFGLIDVTKLSDTNETSTEKLFLNLRSQMLDINHQFVIDLDRWKYTHSSDIVSGTDESYMSKIHLKPHVNLNRPLLIRSKKLKRNAQKFFINQTNIKSSNSTNNNEKSSNLALKTNQTNQQSNNKSVPIFSKPFFTATTGSFSGGINQTGDKNLKKLNQSKKRKQKQIGDSSEEITANEDTNGFKDQSENDDLESSKSVQRTSLYKNKRIRSEENSIDNHEEIEADDEDQDNLKETYQNSVEDKSGKQQKNISSFNKKQVNRIPHETSRARPDPPKLIKSITHTNDTSKFNPQNLPAPPPLYKATTVNQQFSSSANTSRFANASGMNSNLLKNLPKLQSINSSNNPVELSETKEKSSLIPMPKLKLLNCPQQALSKTSIQNSDSHLNQSSESVNSKSKTEKEKSTKSDNVNYINKKTSIMNFATYSKNTNTSNFKAIAPKPSSANTIENEPSVNSSKIKKSENISLKCKFCMQMFKGQSEFFQHVIMTHPKMVKQRLNRNCTGSNGAGVNNELIIGSSLANVSQAVVNGFANTAGSGST